MCLYHNDTIKHVIISHHKQFNYHIHNYIIISIATTLPVHQCPSDMISPHWQGIAPMGILSPLWRDMAPTGHFKTIQHSTWGTSLRPIFHLHNSIHKHFHSQYVSVWIFPLMGHHSIYAHPSLVTNQLHKHIHEGSYITCLVLVKSIK